VPLAASEHFRPIACLPRAIRSSCSSYSRTAQNISGLIDAWARSATHNIDLVIAGRTRADFPPCCEPGLRLLGPVRMKTCRNSIPPARAVVYPSLYEGFGLPVLEAMQCGAIVVTSRDPAIMEVAGDAAIFTAVLNDESVRASWPRARVHWRKRSQLRADPRTGLRRAKQFSWRRTAELTQEVYAEACRVFHY